MVSNAFGLTTFITFVFLGTDIHNISKSFLSKLFTVVRLGMKLILEEIFNEILSKLKEDRGS